MTDWPLQDAKNRFSAVVDAALAGVPNGLPGEAGPQSSSCRWRSTSAFCRQEKANAPTLAELLLDIPQDDQEFDRFPLPSRPLDL